MTPGPHDLDEVGTVDTDELAGYDEEELEVFADEDIYDRIDGHRVTFPGEDLDDD